MCQSEKLVSFYTLRFIHKPLAPIKKMRTGFIKRILKYLRIGKNNQNSTWIETGYGEQIDNPSANSIKKLLRDLPIIDDEHGTFWIGDNNDNSLEINKKGTLFYNFSNPTLEGTCQVNSKKIQTELFLKFNNSKIATVQKILREITGLATKKWTIR